MNEISTKLATELLRRNPRFSHSTVRETIQLAGDASSNRYHRLLIDNGAVTSAVLIQLLHGVGPVYGGGIKTVQDDTYVEIGNYLRKHLIAVPDLYIDARKDHILIVEDIGDCALWSFAFIKDGRDRDEKQMIERYKAAIDILVRIQSLPHDPECIAFKRYLGVEEYRTESRRFIDLFLKPGGATDSVINPVTALVEDLSTRLAAQPKVLTYRDFMSWNIHVGPKGEIRLLDFQDSLLGAPGYDIISLLNDRDTDQALGKAAHYELARYFKDKKGYGKEFTEYFYLPMLQRDLRLAGQFMMLSEKKGNPVYKSWVPGCLTRIGRALKNLDLYPDQLKLLSKLIPEIATGASEEKMTF